MDFHNGNIWAWGWICHRCTPQKMEYLQWGTHSAPTRDALGCLRGSRVIPVGAVIPKLGEAERCWLLQRSSEGSLRLPASNGKVPSAGKCQPGPGKALGDYTEPALSQRKGLIARCLGKCHRMYTHVTSCIYWEKRCWQPFLLFITLLEACLRTGRRPQLLSTSFYS